MGTTKVIQPCGSCGGTGKRLRFSRSRWGDVTDPLTQLVACEPCRGSGVLVDYDLLTAGKPARPALVRVA